MAIGDKFHYNIATEGANTCRPDAYCIQAVLGFKKIVTVVIEEVADRAGGGPLGTTKLRPPKYKVYFKVAFQGRWTKIHWEREFEVEKNPYLNVTAKLVNDAKYAAVQKAFVKYAELKSVKQINKSNEIKVTARLKDDGNNKDKP